ncbi:MAG: hypothetical protein ACYC46_11255 [Acidobacteriaceae bacterium]
MRFAPGLLFALAVTLFPPTVLAYGIAATNPDQKAISDLESRAAHAQPKDQCFLYTELVYKMTEMAAQELSAGQSEQATATLLQVQHYADLIHMGVADNTKKLKNSELLMARTTHRLNDILHEASLEDRPVIQHTLKRLNQIQTELLMQVFRH